jgi:uncharacterized protein (TIGR02246 family)
MNGDEKIKNVGLLTEAFGKFPTFHDSEVAQLILDRGDRKAGILPSLTAKIHVMKVVDKDATSGDLTWGDHLVTLRFFEVEEVDLTSLNRQNVLYDLLIHETSEPETDQTKLEVCFESTYGLSAEFKCSEIAVESVGPLELHEKEAVDEKTKQQRAEFLRKMMLERKNRRAADQRAMSQLREDWQLAMDTRDVSKIQALIAENCVFMPSNQPLVQGRRAIESHYQKVFEQYEISHTVVFEQVKILYDWAWVWGSSEVVRTPRGGGESLCLKGYELLVVNCEEGKWKIACYIDNFAPQDR